MTVTKSGSTGTLYVDGVLVGQNTNMTLGPSSLGSTPNNGSGTPIATTTLTRTPTPPTSGKLLTNGSIESGASGWSVFGSGSLSATTRLVHGGDQSLLLTGRMVAWNGPRQVVTYWLTNSPTYTTNVWVRMQSGTASAKMTPQLTANGSTAYVTLALAMAVNSYGWTLLSGTDTVSWSGTLSSANFYVETTSGTAVFCIDDASFQ